MRKSCVEGWVVPSNKPHSWSSLLAICASLEETPLCLLAQREGSKRLPALFVGCVHYASYDRQLMVVGAETEQSTTVAVCGCFLRHISRRSQARRVIFVVLPLLTTHTHEYSLARQAWPGWKFRVTPVILLRHLAPLLTSTLRS